VVDGKNKFFPETSGVLVQASAGPVRSEKTMKVKELLKEKGRDVVAVGAGLTLSEVAARMTERNIGAVLVEQGGGLVGFLSERDIVRALSRTGLDAFGRLAVRDIMIPSERLLVAEPDDEIDYVMAVMIQRGIRHMPIVENGELAGILSIRDVVKAHVQKRQAEIRFLTEFIE